MVARFYEEYILLKIIRYRKYSWNKRNLFLEFFKFSFFEYHWHLWERITPFIKEEIPLDNIELNIGNIEWKAADYPRILDHGGSESACSILHRFFRPRKKVGHEFFLRHYLSLSPPLSCPTSQRNPPRLPSYVCLPSNRSLSLTTLLNETRPEELFE